MDPFPRSLHHYQLQDKEKASKAEEAHKKEKDMKEKKDKQKSKPKKGKEADKKNVPAPSLGKRSDNKDSSDIKESKAPPEKRSRFATLKWWAGECFEYGVGETMPEVIGISRPGIVYLFEVCLRGCGRGKRGVCTIKVCLRDRDTA